MHPVCRHPVHERRHHPCIHYRAESNRLGLALGTFALGRFGATGIDPEDPMSYGNEDVSNQVLGKKFTIDEVYQAIFRCETPFELARVLNWPAGIGVLNSAKFPIGHEQRQVNFTSYVESVDLVARRDVDLPVVLQFRQAKGSLDATDIEAWVTFCQDLVLLAMRLATANHPFLPVHRWSEMVLNGRTMERRHSNISVFDLMDMMKYTDAQKTYWMLRMAKCQCYTPGDKDDEYVVEQPPRGWTCE